MVKNGKLYEPELTSALIGITRDTVITLARRLGYTVAARRITRDDLYIADEAFFTGTAAEVTPIREVDGRKIGAGKRARSPRSCRKRSSTWSTAERQAPRLADAGRRLMGQRHGTTTERKQTASHRGDGSRPAAALPDAGDAAVERASARVPADRENRRGALPLLRHALHAQGRRRAGALALNVNRKGAKTLKDRKERFDALTLRRVEFFAPCVLAATDQHAPDAKILIVARPGSATRCSRSRCSSACTSAIAISRSTCWRRPGRARCSRACRRSAPGIDSPFGHGELALRARWRSGAAWRRARYDQAIVLPNSFKSALIPFFADIPLRTGFVGESRYGSAQRRAPARRAALPLMAERFAQLAEAAGDALQRPLPPARLKVDHAQRAAHARRLGLDRSGRSRCCARAPNTARPSAGRPHLRRARAQLAARGYAVWLIGSGKDAEIGEEIARASGTPASTCAARARSPRRSICCRAQRWSSATTRG